jgi:prevent-host-death family protein
MPEAPENRVGVRELRQYLSRYLRRVERGETLEVTERGKPVALLVPLPSAREGAVARLQAQGRLIRAGGGSLGSLALPASAPAGAPSLSEALEGVRGDRV